VKINVNLPLDGRRRFHGTIKEVDGDRIVIEQDGVPVSIVHANIAKARLAPDYAALGLAAARREYEEGAPKKRKKK
jgi:ribosome maturation factor RimP